MAEQKHMAGPMGGGPRGMMPGEKAKDFKGTMGKLHFIPGQISARHHRW